MASDPVERAVAFTIENWDALGVQDQDGILHLPASIKRRDAKGGVAQTPVMLRNVTNRHKFTCRTIARGFAKDLNLDLDRDKDLIDEIENYAILSYAIRDPRKPFDQHVPDVQTLVATYDTQSLAELWGVYDSWVSMLDPRFGELSAEQLWQTIARIAKEKSPSPLVALPTPGQYTCVVAMAQAAMDSPMRPSWLAS